MKIKRSLSGIYFRYKNPETNKFENWCFEDLPESEQYKILASKGDEWLRSMVTALSKTINQISEQFDITAEKEETE